MEQEYTLTLKAFMLACQYLQKHAPSHINPKDEDYIQQLNAIAGCNTYEDGWQQWFDYFLNKAILM